jgi:hypothetical protein
MDLYKDFAGLRLCKFYLLNGQGITAGIGAVFAHLV